MTANTKMTEVRMSDWFCEYCQETSNPMYHGCNIVTLKSRLSHLSAVNEHYKEALEEIREMECGCDENHCLCSQRPDLIAGRALKLAYEMGEK